MIKGLYEAHLPVTDLERAIEFYRSLGLEKAFVYPDVVFMWIEKRRSWLGLWLVEAISEERNPSFFPGHGRHLAFQIDFEDLLQAMEWLREKGIQPIPFEHFKPTEPVARPHQLNASIYFEDPDGNQLELICNLPTNYLSEPEEVVYFSELKVKE
ncbi:VOC family protein [Paenibacillus sediminis]|uniref:Glutathione S-transferase n=1 Tax=Paenibacillus sediminis TaxID=664909 RepID=A0ABS4H7L8_9BACL|nr:VOC family protein [Paenibacillus sediminis]MBP1938080.1 glutathione S-transferase [Paenibacillus sediminis]